MSLIFCDGFDDGLTLQGKWTTLSGASVNASYGRNGSGMRLLESTSFAQKVLNASDEHATITVGFAFRIPAFNGGSDAPVLSLKSDSGATTHLYVQHERTTDVLRIYRGAGVTLLATDTLSLVANQWYYLELKATLHDSTGSYELRINGSTRLQATNIDTKNAGTKAVFDSFAVHGAVWNSTGSHVDDLYVCNGAGAANNTFLGDLAIETLLPDGNGNSSQFVGSDGNSVDNYQLVDEATPSTVDYVAGASVGNKDTYAFGDMVRTSGGVVGVMVSSYANKSDSNPRTIKNVARSVATEAQSASNTLTTTWVPHSSVFEVDPSTTTAWTIGSVNSAEFGVEVDA